MKPVRLLPSAINSNVLLQLLYDYDDDFEDDSTIVECQFELHGMSAQLRGVQVGSSQDYTPAFLSRC